MFCSAFYTLKYAHVYILAYFYYLLSYWYLTRYLYNITDDWMIQLEIKNGRCDQNKWEIVGDSGASV